METACQPTAKMNRVQTRSSIWSSQYFGRPTTKDIDDLNSYMRPFLNAEATGNIDEQYEVIVCQFLCPGQGKVQDKAKSDLHETRG